MKKILSSLVLLATMLCATFALADTYGPEGAKFTLTPQPGWTAKAIDSGVQLQKGNSVLVINVAPHGGAELTAIADGVITASGLTDAKKDKDDDTVIIVGKKDGVDLKIILVKADDKNMVSFTMAGSETDDMSKMIDSIKDVE